MPQPWVQPREDCVRGFGSGSARAIGAVVALLGGASVRPAAGQFAFVSGLFDKIDGINVFIAPYGWTASDAFNADWPVEIGFELSVALMERSGGGGGTPSLPSCRALRCLPACYPAAPRLRCPWPCC